jgi:hypothetical protein
VSGVPIVRIRYRSSTQAVSGDDPHPNRLTNITASSGAS